MRLVQPAPLLTGLTGERREQALRLGLGILLEVPVPQHLVRRGATVRVQGQQVREQRTPSVSELREPGADDGSCGGGRRLRRQPEGPGIRQAAERRPGLRGGNAAELEDLGDLVDFVGALEEGVAGEELGEDAAHAPHIDGPSVGPGAEEEFRGAVPEGDDQLGQLGRRVSHVACHAKIGDL